jgi:7,8-dihydropterin-6-yl-methyl-4-(beta-D-ribofuranosyl)aminobenzene 5'-phosphate synthase
VIATPSTTVLFDTGSDGTTLLSNMEKLNVEPRTIRNIVISHLHDDHVGGLTALLRANADVLVLLPARSPGPLHRMIDAAGAKHRDVLEPTTVAPAVRTTGPWERPFRAGARRIDRRGSDRHHWLARIPASFTS